MRNVSICLDENAFTKAIIFGIGPTLAVPSFLASQLASHAIAGCSATHCSALWHRIIVTSSSERSDAL